MSGKVEITETLKAANLYLTRLENLNCEIHNAQRQITSTSSLTKNKIENVFDRIINDIADCLNSRKKELLNKIENTENRSLAPLNACQIDVAHRIKETTELINEGQSLMISGAIDSSDLNLDRFYAKSSLLGGLPVIPELKEVPYLTFQYEPQSMAELQQISRNFGEVSQIAPVQISQTIEKPGAILVEWQGVDDGDRFRDIQEFRLQRAFGDVNKAKPFLTNFTDCYQGLETQFLVKDLLADQPYSFRVCCKFEGSSEWSPWSIPQVATTLIKPFSWSKNEDYILADDNKIATPIAASPSILLSDGPQFHAGHSVEFTYLEYDPKTPVTLGLLLIKDSAIGAVRTIKSQDHNYFAFDGSGEICVDGVCKSTKLPEVSKGLKVCFACEAISDDKIRVNVDSCDKIVTYDWHISKNSKLYFAAQFQSSNCKIMVE